MPSHNLQTVDGMNQDHAPTGALQAQELSNLIDNNPSTRSLIATGLMAQDATSSATAGPSTLRPATSFGTGFHQNNKNGLDKTISGNSTTPITANDRPIRHNLTDNTLEGANSSNNLPQNDNQQRPLTFGIELEFILAAHTDSHDPLRRVPRPGQQDLLIPKAPSNTYHAYHSTKKIKERYNPDSPWDTVIKDIGSEFEAQGIPVYHYGREQHTSGWIVTGDSSVRHHGDSANIYYPANVHYTGVEVVSRILTGDESGFEETRRAASILDKDFRTEVNRTCGLHVHVGDGKVGFSLETLANLFGVLWVFDSEITRLHPRHRTSRRGYEFCKSFRRSFQDTCGLLAGDVRAMLGRFYKAKTPYALGLLLPPSRYVAYNFKNLSAIKGAPAGSHIETIEFRQHEGTLHADRIENWARFCVRVVEWAMETSREEMMAFLFPELERQHSGQGMKLWEFVDCKLGLPDVAQAFETFILEKERLRALRKEVKQQEQAHDAFSAMALLFEMDGGEVGESAEEVELVKAEIDMTTRSHYEKGANKPCAVYFDSDAESEYGESDELETEISRPDMDDWDEAAMPPVAPQVVDELWARPADEPWTDLAQSNPVELW